MHASFLGHPVYYILYKLQCLCGAGKSFSNMVLVFVDRLFVY